MEYGPRRGSDAFQVASPRLETTKKISYFCTMLKEKEESRCFMKRLKSTGEMTEPCGTPVLTECRLERKPSTLTAIDLSERKLPIQLMRVLLRPNVGSLARRLLRQTRSKALEISREITLLSPLDSRAEDQTWTA